MSGSNRLGSPYPSIILTVPLFAKVRTVLFTVSNEMLGKIILALSNGSRCLELIEEEIYIASNQ